jgi:hypothetical protein
MAVNRKYDILAIVMMVVAIIAYASFRSEYRLREKMPAEFFDPASVPSKTRAAEVAVARAYWDCAVKQIQWKYGYAHRLPEEVPDDFVLMGQPASANDPLIRERYWRKLRSAWTVSSVWEERYELNRISFGDSLRSAGAWLERHMRAIVGYS